ncbi:5373_t:CDS:2, partial [Acaulospora colombiana]
ELEVAACGSVLKEGEVGRRTRGVTDSANREESANSKSVELLSVRTMSMCSTCSIVNLSYVADAPTTTLQRLKALTTGTLPTFIDAGSNFAGSAIIEDNLIYQLFGQNKKIAFMGDDTWLSLFPDQFDPTMTNPFPSFNVWDLNTVDDGILRLLGPTLRGGNGVEDLGSGSHWDVLIAHFLGVDHCGHRYGPDHPAMAEKLRQMNKMIGDVIRDVDEDTVVLIMGDHGMDSKGDHGGDSDNEVESALFVYSKKNLTHDSSASSILSQIHKKLDEIDGHGVKSFTSKYGNWRSIPQIDFVPTLSLLLGIPIPFNNLGSLIPEMFLHNSETNNEDDSVEKQLTGLLDVMRLNAMQVFRYTMEYSKQRPSDLSKENLHEIRDMFNKAEEDYKLLKSLSDRPITEDFVNSIVLYMSFLRNTLFICRRIWAQFDVALMISGISVLIASCFCVVLHLVRNTKEQTFFTNYAAVRHALVGGSFGAVLARMGSANFMISPLLRDSNFSTLDFIIIGASFGSIIGYLIEFVRSGAFPKIPKNFPLVSFDTLLSLLFLILHSLLFASNSFTVFEDRITLVLIQTFGAYTFFRAFRIKNRQLFLRTIFLSLGFLIATRIASYSTICREEQMPYCTPTFYISSSSTLSSPFTLVVLVAMSALMPFFIRRVLQISKSYHGIAPFWIDIGLRSG